MATIKVDSTAKWEIQEAIKYAFDAQGIEIPFDQMEVTLKNKDV